MVTDDHYRPVAGLGEIASSSPVVSLSNWKRLSSTLFELPQLCAVYWRDFIVVMNVSEGEYLRYKILINVV